METSRLIFFNYKVHIILYYILITAFSVVMSYDAGSQGENGRKPVITLLITLSHHFRCLPNMRSTSIQNNNKVIFCTISVGFFLLIMILSQTKSLFTHEFMRLQHLQWQILGKWGGGGGMAPLPLPCLTILH